MVISGYCTVLVSYPQYQAFSHMASEASRKKILRPKLGPLLQDLASSQSLLKQAMSNTATEKPDQNKQSPRCGYKENHNQGNLFLKLRFHHRYGKSKIDCLRFVMCPVTSTGLSRLLFAVAINSTNEANKAGGTRL